MSRPLPRREHASRLSHADAPDRQGDVNLPLLGNGSLVRRSLRQQLALAYRSRAALDEHIERLEAAVELARQQNGGRHSREFIRHGDESAYRRHVRRGIPFPEDEGGDPCGCRVAHSRYEAIRRQRADDRRNGVQLTIHDAIREAARGA